MPPKKAPNVAKSRSRSTSSSRATKQESNQEKAFPTATGDSSPDTTKSTKKRKSVAKVAPPPSPPPSRSNPPPSNTHVRHSARIQQKREQRIQQEHDDEVAGPATASPLQTLLKRVLRTTVTTSRREPLVSLEDVPSHTRMHASKERFFGGILGTLILLLLLPCVLLGVTLMCSAPGNLRRVTPPQVTEVYFNRNVSLVYAGWVASHAVFSLLPIGRLVQGPWVALGEASEYRSNGFWALLLSMAITGWIAYSNSLPITYLYDHWIAVATTLTIFSLVLTLLAYLKSIRSNKLSIDGNSGWWHYDLFMGRELNTHILGVDLKSFCCLRAGLFTWFFLDVVCLLKDWEVSHKFNPALILLIFFHFAYVSDAVFFEDGFLMTPTISHEGFGFLLSFGSLAWTPLVFSLTTRFMVENPSCVVPLWVTPILLIVNMIGFIIYRGANSQKNDFKRDPSNPAFSGLDVMSTNSGKLLVGGWWGWVRHPNYLGDLIMAITWSTLCGVNFLLPWFYPLYLFVFLLHRIYRDERAMTKKYGLAYIKYKKLVPYRLIPRVF